MIRFKTKVTPPHLNGLIKIILYSNSIWSKITFWKASFYHKHFSVLKEVSKKSIRYHRSKNKNLPCILILSTCYPFFNTTKNSLSESAYRTAHHFCWWILTSLAHRISLRNNALSSSDFLKTTWEVKHRGGWAKWPCPHFDNTITQILTMYTSTHHTDPYNTQI